MDLDHLKDAYRQTNYDLLGLLRANASTAFGRHHGFHQIQTVEDYQSAVPLLAYEALEPWIMRAADGELGVLTAEPVVGFETTSGSSGSEKWIPYTARFQSELANALTQWLDSWSQLHPSVLEGPAYWSLSPSMRKPRQTPGGHPLGFASDAGYFPSVVAAMLEQWLIVPPTLAPDGDSFYATTVDALLDRKELRLVSVWSPTFFLRLDSALRDRAGDRPWSEVWPKLALVSCWTDAASALWIEEVKARAGVQVEGKGLAATEGVTSIPSVDGLPVIASGVHFHEFLGPDGHVSLAHELCQGRTYEVVLTTGAGLYRYRTGDLIDVIDDAMHLRFAGRVGNVSDLVGEKLTEAHVISAMIQAGARGWMEATETGYRISLEGGSAVAFERSLRENPYFDHALKLGQLAPLNFRSLAPGWEQSRIEMIARERQCPVGDVKLPVLIPA